MASNLEQLRRLLVFCLVIFLVILAAGIAIKLAHATKMAALESCAGTGCLTYGERNLGFVRFSSPFINIGLLGCGLSLVGLSLLKIKKRQLEDVDIKKSIKMSGLALAASLIFASVGVLLTHTYLSNNADFRSCRTFYGYEKCKQLEQHKVFMKIGAPLAHLGIASTAVSTIYLVCSAYVLRASKRNE